MVTEPTAGAPETADAARALRPGGLALRRADFLLRWGLASALGAAALLALPDAAAPWLLTSTTGVSAAGHAIPRAPRAASLLGLAAGIGFALWVAPARGGSVLLCAALIAGSSARLALHLGERGRWLLRVHALEQQRRRALLGTGLATAHGSLEQLAGDLYEEDGFARRALGTVGARPRRAELWRIAPAAIGARLGGLPGLGASARRGFAAYARWLAARVARRRATAGAPVSA